jgi:hydroxyacylglutathione hydrolase
MKILQILVGGFDKNFTYLVFNEKKEGFLIDATANKEKIEEEIKKNQITLTHQLITHNHPDHTELVNYFQKKNVKLIDFKELKKNPNFILNGIKVQTIFTPGHTIDSRCYLIENNLFTGDTLFTRGIGTTAYGGNDKDLKESLNLLETLNKNIIIWPGHKYGKDSCLLKEALSFAHNKPSEKVLDEIKKRIKEYEFNVHKQ